MHSFLLIAFLIGTATAQEFSQSASASSSASFSGSTGYGVVPSSAIASSASTSLLTSASTSVSASASASVSGSFSTPEPAPAPVPVPAPAPAAPQPFQVQASAQASANVQYSQPQPQPTTPVCTGKKMSFKGLSMAEVRMIQAQTGMKFKITVSKPGTKLIKTPLSELVKELKSCAPPPCVYVPPEPCVIQPNTKKVKASASASSKVSFSLPSVTLDDCEPEEGETTPVLEPEYTFGGSCYSSVEIDGEIVDEQTDEIAPTTYSGTAGDISINTEASATIE